MTSRRVRTIELLAAGDLARSNLARDEARGQRDAEQTSRWVNALSSMIPAAVDAGGKVYDVATENAVNDATALAASKSDVMDQTEANDIVEANFKEPQNEDWLSSLGSRFTAPIRAKAKATAATSLSEMAAKNTATRAAKEAADKKEADAALERTRAEARQSWADEKDFDEKTARRDDAQQKREQDALDAEADRASRERIAAMKKKGGPGKGTPNAPTKALPAEQTQKLVDIGEALATLDEVAKMKGDYNTGPLASKARAAVDFIPGGEAIADFVGLDQSGYNRFSSKTLTLLQLVGKLLEGGKLAEGDAKRYARILASPETDDVAFNGVLADMKQTLLRQQQNSSAAFGESFKVPSTLKPKAAAAPTTEKALEELTDEELDAAIKAAGG